MTPEQLIIKIRTLEYLRNKVEDDSYLNPDYSERWRNRLKCYELKLIQQACSEWCKEAFQLGKQVGRDEEIIKNALKP